jgi:ABC-type multidrug transport system ATPase subunit
VFLTTHYLEEAEEADSICIIDKGKIVSFGSPDKIKSQLVEEYVIVDADDRTRLRGELSRLELPISGEGPFKINAHRPRRASSAALDRDAASGRAHACAEPRGRVPGDRRGGVEG